MSMDQRLRLAAHQLADGLNPPDVDLDALRERARSNRRRTMSVAVAAIAAVIALIAVGLTILGGRNTSAPQPANPSPSSVPTAPSPPPDEWSLERIRAEGSTEPGAAQVTESGITTRVYVVCDGPRSECENDPPLRVPYQHVALEVTQDHQSALFALGANEQYAAQGFGADSVFVMDDPRNDAWGTIIGLRYRVLRADGGEVQLQLLDGLAPAVPDPRVYVIDFDAAGGGLGGGYGAETVYFVDLLDGTLQPLDVPNLGAPGSLYSRYWGPNVDEFLWYVDPDCRVGWATAGTFEKHRLDCGKSRDGVTYIYDDGFPDGWLKPGRMVAVEPNNGRLFLHVSLDYGLTWQRIPVNDEAAIPDALQQLG